MKKIVYVISNTSSRKLAANIYLTSIRSIGDIEIRSILVSGEIDFKELYLHISKISNLIFVDIEKKQPLNQSDSSDFGANLYKSFIEVDQLPENKDVNLEIHPIKMNDLTVSSVINQLFIDFKDISGMRASLIGLGNIGFKLSLALTESGVHLHCYNRDIQKALTCNAAVCLTKPTFTITSPSTSLSAIHSIVNSQFCIIASSRLSEDLSEVTTIVKPGYIFYVLGHSLFEKECLSRLIEHGVIIKRIDVGPTICSYVLGTSKASKLYNYGSKKMGKHTICSGGFVGFEGDLVVDNFRSPSYIIGECDGKAGLKPRNENTNSLGELNLSDLASFDW